MCVPKSFRVEEVFITQSDARFASYLAAQSPAVWQIVTLILWGAPVTNLFVKCHLNLHIDFTLHYIGNPASVYVVRWLELFELCNVLKTSHTCIGVDENNNRGVRQLYNVHKMWLLRKTHPREKKTLRVWRLPGDAQPILPIKQNICRRKYGMFYW